jgi:hypothetical protein
MKVGLSNFSLQKLLFADATVRGMVNKTLCATFAWGKRFQEGPYFLRNEILKKFQLDI